MFIIKICSICSDLFDFCLVEALPSRFSASLSVLSVLSVRPLFLDL